MFPSFLMDANSLTSRRRSPDGALTMDGESSMRRTVGPIRGSTTSMPLLPPNLTCMAPPASLSSWRARRAASRASAGDIRPQPSLKLWPSW